MPNRVDPQVREERAREFGERVRALRKAAGMTQEQLARATGLSRNQVQNIELSRNNARDESGKLSPGVGNPRFDTIWALAEALGVEAADLVRRDTVAT
ncbi:helix-turn-helix domain-containing protein [Mumia zhuanghuii]|nr:helix-turn-helix transcriptional regulator [Mumia zhuanghuii]